MKQRSSFSRLFIPLSILVFLAFALFVERSGITYSMSSKPIEFLEPAAENPQQETTNEEFSIPDTLILYDPTDIDYPKTVNQYLAILDYMRVKYVDLDISRQSETDFFQYHKIVLALAEYETLSEHLPDLLNWLDAGGKLLVAVRPDNTQSLKRIAPNLGITHLDNNLIKTTGIEFFTEMLPGVAGMRFGSDFFNHTILPVVLDPRAKLHMVSADEIGAPILWEWEQGFGKVVFINSDQFSTKSARGLLGAAYGLLHDIVVYPVINASVFYIDDFPSPVPEGKDVEIFKQFTRDIESFYLNVWWPDMQALQEKYNLVYSAVTIQTYQYKTDPPFQFLNPQQDLFQYFGGLVLRNGGEVGIHGYNHIPLCVEADKTNEVLDYPYWDSIDDMKKATIELAQFNRSLYPEQKIFTYVPPSNILCSDARQWLPDVVEDLRVIASVYLPDANVPAYVQEFEEADDGVIELPRITSGFLPDNFAQWAAINELWLHYYFGHFVHPDDVLDSYRSKGSTWLEMRELMDEFLLWIYSSAPGMRNLTAAESAMAVQRYDRLDVDYRCDKDACLIELDNFYDEAWLMFRSEEVPVSISGGDFRKAGKNAYLIEAFEASITIRFGEE